MFQKFLSFDLDTSHPSLATAQIRSQLFKNLGCFVVFEELPFTLNRKTFV